MRKINNLLQVFTNQGCIDWFITLIDASIKGSILLIAVLLLYGFYQNVSSSSKFLLLFLSSCSLLVLPILSNYVHGSKVKIYQVITRDDLLIQQAKKAANFTESVGGEIMGSYSDGVNSASAILSPDNLVTILFLIWILGFLMVNIKNLLGIAGAYQIKLKSQKWTEDHMICLVKSISKDIGLTRQVDVLLGGKVYIPFTFGFFKPFVVFPYAAMNWADNRLKVVLTHELMHIKRYDGLTQLLSNFICSLYWFNPLIWMISKKMCEEKENACDEGVLDTGVEPCIYAWELIDIVKSCQLPGCISNTVSNMAKKSSTEKRIVNILSREQEQKRISHRRIFLYPLLIITITISFNFMNTITAHSSQSVSQISINTENLLRLESNLEAAKINHEASKFIPSFIPFQTHGGVADNLHYSVSAVGFDDNAVYFNLEKGCTPIVASASGRVSQISDKDMSQSYIMVEHEGGFSTLYAPIYETQLKEGDFVSRGQIIAHTYNMPEARFEIRHNSKAIHPKTFLILR